MRDSESAALRPMGQKPPGIRLLAARAQGPSAISFSLRDGTVSNTQKDSKAVVLRSRATRWPAKRSPVASKRDTVARNLSH